LQDFYAIRQRCLESGILFNDPNFPANSESLFPTQQLEHDYEWLRPKDICNDPQFFIDSFSRFDVLQGVLKDCWLLAAVANITQNEKLFYRVVCEDNKNGFDGENYAGIFHFR
jgi:calpain, invertebrate